MDTMSVCTFTWSFSDINFELIGLLQHDVVGAASEALTHLRRTQAALLSGRGLQARGGRAGEVCVDGAQGPRGLMKRRRTSRRQHVFKRGKS